MPSSEVYASVAVVTALSIAVAAESRTWSVAGPEAHEDEIDRLLDEGVRDQSTSLANLLKPIAEVDWWPDAARLPLCSPSRPTPITVSHHDGERVLEYSHVVEVIDACDARFQEAIPRLQRLCGPESNPSRRTRANRS